MTVSRRPISFVATVQPEKAKAFYRDVLGLKLLESSPYALVFGDGDAMLRVQIVPELGVAPYTVHGWQVTDIAREIEALVSKGVTFLMFDQFRQDEMGIWTSPDGHKIAWLKDPCGNILSLTEFS
jgi:catechol 2,3-dioxygenase-like lactoylglutathione lyase family enzyme